MTNHDYEELRKADLLLLQSKEALIVHYQIKINDLEKRYKILLDEYEALRRDNEIKFNKDAL